MAFWGVKVTPGKPCGLNFDRSRGRLRITQATLGNGKSEVKSTVQCSVDSSCPVSLCTLLPNLSETCHLELEFDEDKEVIFSVLGSRSIHLTGYYPGHVRHLDGDDTESYGEDIAESDTSDNYTGGSEDEDEYESDFIDDDDVEVYTDFPAHKSSVVIEEIEDDDKPCVKTRKLRCLKKKHETSTAENSETVSKQLVVRKNEPSKEESEDEDGFPTCFTTNSRSSQEKIDDDKTSKMTGISHDSISEKKCKTDDIDTVFISEANEDHDFIMEAESAHVCDKKSKKKKKKVNTPSKGSENDDKQNKQNESAKVEEKSVNTDISMLETHEHTKESKNGAKDTYNSAVNAPVTSGAPDTCKMKKKNKKKRAIEEGISDEKVPCEDNLDTNKLSQEMPTDKKNKPKKSKKKNCDSDINHEASTKEKNDVINSIDGLQDGSHSIKTRTFPNGLIVEEVHMGQPEGRKASPGKKVSVRYIGKLKNGTIFDSNIGQRPFKFRLGIGEVIKGWDIGVSGMRVGDKRRLTIPPSFGYGSKGAGKIPPNSWLVFDVELVDVQ